MPETIDAVSRLQEIKERSRALAENGDSQHVLELVKEDVPWLVERLERAEGFLAEILCGSATVSPTLRKVNDFLEEQ